jgi:Bacteriophage related domain of unknown function
MTAVGVESQITEALLTRLSALTLSPTLPVAYPDVAFTPPSAGMWLEAAILRATTGSIGISAWEEHAGIFQVTVVAPKGGGAIKSTQVADAVTAWFPRFTRLLNGAVQVDVYDSPNIAAAIDDPPYTRTPVSIRYRTFVR